MKYLILIITASLTLLMFISADSFARTLSEDQVKELITNAPESVTYPQAAVIVLSHTIAKRINKDLSAEIDEHLIVKILQERGKFAYGDIKRRFNKEVDSIVVLTAVTHLPDGTILPVEEKAINDINPSWLTNASVYSNIMQKVINFSGIAPGVTIELKLKTYSKAPDEDEKDEQFFVSGTKMFQGDNPIFYKELSVTVPEEIGITYTVQNEGLDYQKAVNEGMITHTWWIEHSQQIIPEPFMPNYVKIAPRLIYTNANSWDEVGSWFAEKFYPHVKTDGDVKKKAEKLIKDANSRVDKINELALYVISDIRNVAEYTLPPGVAGYEPHDANEVLANKYGDWRDKAVLLVSLLRSAKIKAYPVFVHRNSPTLSEEHPSLKQFNALYVYLPEYNGAPLWVNPFADECRLGYFLKGQGSTAFLVRENSSELLTVVDMPPEANYASSVIELDINNNGDVEGSIVCEVDGYFDYLARNRLKTSTPKELEQYFSIAANNIGEGSISSKYELTDLNDLLMPIKIAQSFETPDLAIVQGDMMIFYMPHAPYGFTAMPFVPAQTMRTFDFEMVTDFNLKTEGWINLPDGFKAVYISEPVHFENEFGIWTSKYELDENRNAIYYISNLLLKDDYIDTDEYYEFKQTFDNFTKPRNLLVLLEKR